MILIEHVYGFGVLLLMRTLLIKARQGLPATVNYTSRGQEKKAIMEILSKKGTRLTDISFNSLSSKSLPLALLMHAAHLVQINAMLVQIIRS
jgi:hypothetical protein